MKLYSDRVASFVSASILFIVTAGSALAASVDVNINVPGAYSPVPQPVYVAPQRVYVAPQPTYVQPRPVYVRTDTRYVDCNKHGNCNGKKFKKAKHHKHHSRHGGPKGHSGHH